MTQKELTQLDKIEIKLDFLFGIISNDKMAVDFLTAYQGEMNQENPNDEIIKKTEEMFQYHTKNIKDSIAYFVEIFGKESNDRIVGLIHEVMEMKENEASEQKGPDTVVEPASKSTHTSEKVEG
jgi:hypothetical protein